MFKIVLFQPEIPANTGNIGRLCVGCNAELHLIKPMRFLLSDKYLKRAGLDYWQDLKLVIHEDLADFQKDQGGRIFYCSTKAEKCYTAMKYKEGDAFVFGPETRGLPESLLTSNRESVITIPMSHKIRSLNLSNSAAIVLYEALRQINWKGEKNINRRIIC